ncbi:steryl-sulfatase-like [Sycon ciliatum]|uniref:steryl-sulfatase-like n=1 Tax=Sycon ciliatum TaxID=27933 RepID=UPI0031F6479C|eukprot:scpid46413/ scgid13615/ N-acetylgalactosamine-6-sulfatase; Chondroitinsulfatase; Galactose-6-sulfate sulfatase; N-acetylgalactosamine-6-sulfate sulfatase
MLQAVVLVLALSLTALAQEESRPNVVFILADDWGWGDVGIYNGDRRSRTPRLDEMGRKGTVFTDFHVANPVCSPSRTAFMTGRHPASLKIHTALTGNHAENAARGCADYLPHDIPTLTLLLQGAGYTTGHFGKWHLGATEDAPPPSEYGIDSSATYVSTDPTRLPGCSGPPNPGPNTKLNCSDQLWPGRSSKAIVDLGMEFINNASVAKKPFYLNLWFHISHAPLNLMKEQLTNFSMQTFCPWSGMTPDLEDFTSCPEQIFRAAQHDADVHIGRMLDFLQSKGLDKNTLVVFSADNGPEDVHIYFNSVGTAGPFRGRKRSIYEGGVRVPFITYWPGKIPANKVSDATVSSLDWFPTIATITNTTIPANWMGSLRGVDITDLIMSGVPLKERVHPLMWEWRYALQGNCWNEAPRVAIRAGDMKLLMNTNATYVELYNLTTSPFEANNVAGQNPELVQNLTIQLKNWIHELPEGPIVENKGCRGYKIPEQHP